MNKPTLHTDKYNMHRGFTLVEVLVSVAIFTTVMMVATGAVFSIVAANKKTHTLKSVMTNLNFALESMARDIRLGKSYQCDDAQDCSAGGAKFTFKASRDINGDLVLDNDFVDYTLVGGAIERYVYGGLTGTNRALITAPEIHITNLRFYVSGTSLSDTLQPKVVITIQGYAGNDATRSDFNIETTVSQRSIDS